MRKLLSALLCAILIAPSLPATTAASPYSTAILADTPIGYWRLGGFTTSVADSSGNSYTGTATATAFGGNAGPMLYDSTPDTAFQFTGSSSNIVLANTGMPTDSSHFDFEYNQPFSVDLWARFHGQTFGTNSDIDIIGNRKATSNNNGWKVFISGISGPEQLHYIMEANDGSHYVWVRWTTTTFVPWTWYHIVVTVSGSHLASGIKAYINGVLQTQAVVTDNLGTNTTVTGLPLYIGSSGSGAGPMKGELDEVAVYGTALTQAQVLNHLGASSYPRGLQTLPPCNGTPQPIIVDSDPGTDTDDYHDQYMWMALAKLGCFNVLGHSIVQVPTYAAASGKLLSLYGGLSGLLYGAYQGAVAPQADNYATSSATQFNYLNARATFTTATTALRTWLNNAANASVILIATGPITNISDLLDTAAGADGIADSGITLVTNKVTAIYWVAGYWPTGSSESNWIADPAGTTNLFAKWPAAVPVVMFGIDVGNQISIGAATWAISDTSLTSIGCASNVCTVTTLSPHGLRGGDLVNVLGATVDTDLNKANYAITYLTTTTFSIATTSVADATYTDATLQVVGGLQPFMDKVTNPEAWAMYNATAGPKSGNRINWSGIAIVAAAYGVTNVLAYGGSGGTICSKTAPACSIACGNDVVGSSAACYGWESSPNHGRAYISPTFTKWSSAAFSEFLDRLLKRELHIPWIMPQ